MIKFADEMTYPELKVALKGFMEPLNPKGFHGFVFLKALSEEEFHKRGATTHEFSFGDGNMLTIIMDAEAPHRTVYRPKKYSRGPRESFMRAAVGYLCPEGFDFPD